MPTYITLLHYTQQGIEKRGSRSPLGREGSSVRRRFAPTPRRSTGTLSPRCRDGWSVGYTWGLLHDRLSPSPIGDQVRSEITIETLSGAGVRVLKT